MTPGMAEDTRYSAVTADCICMENNPEGRDASCPVHGTGKSTVFEPNRRIGPPCTCGAENLAIFEGHGNHCIFEIARIAAMELVDKEEITQEQAKQRMIDWEHWHPEFDAIIREKWGKDISSVFPDEVKNEVIIPVKGTDKFQAVPSTAFASNIAEVVGVENTDENTRSKPVTVDIWVWRHLIADEEGPRHPMIPQFARISLDTEQVRLLNAQAPIPPGYHAGNWAIHDPDGELDLTGEET